MGKSQAEVWENISGLSVGKYFWLKIDGSHNSAAPPFSYRYFAAFRIIVWGYKGQKNKKVEG